MTLYIRHTFFCIQKTYQVKLRYDYSADKEKLEKAFDLRIFSYERKKAISLTELSELVIEGKPKEEKFLFSNLHPRHQTNIAKAGLEIQPDIYTIRQKLKKRGLRFEYKFRLGSPRDLEKNNR